MTTTGTTSSPDAATHNLTGVPVLRPERRLSFSRHSSMGTVSIHPCEPLPGLRVEPALAQHTARFDVLVPEGMSVRLTLDRWNLRRDYRPVADWPWYALDELSAIAVALGDWGLRRFAGLTGLRFLDLYGADVTNAAGETFAALTGLEWLSLSFTQVGTPGVASLTGLEHLIRLSLRGTPITDAALVALCDLPNLRWLSVADTGVSVEGLRWLMRRAPQLRSLAVNGTPAATDPQVLLVAAEHGVELFEHP